MKIGHNNVEYSLERNNYCNNSFKMKSRMKMMRNTISSVYELLRKSQSSCNATWCEYKQITPHLYKWFYTVFKKEIKVNHKKI